MTEVIGSAESVLHDFEIIRQFTGANCQPSPTSISGLQSADVVLVSGQFIGGGKSTFIQALEREGRVNVPSWTNRDLRPGEVEGVDKCQRPPSIMADRAKSGYFLELEELRPGCFYATPSEFAPGNTYVKDVELKGALRLRSFASKLVVVPLPPVYEVPEKRVSEWERRVVLRGGFLSSIDTKATDDLSSRLGRVVDEVDRVLSLGLVYDPSILFVVNDDLLESLGIMHAFLKTGEKLGQEGIEGHLQAMRAIAVASLEAS